MTIKISKSVFRFTSISSRKRALCYTGIANEMHYFLRFKRRDSSTAMFRSAEHCSDATRLQTRRDADGRIGDARAPTVTRSRGNPRRACVTQAEGSRDISAWPRLRNGVARASWRREWDLERGSEYGVRFVNRSHAGQTAISPRAVRTADQCRLGNNRVYAMNTADTTRKTTAVLIIN